MTVRRFYFVHSPRALNEHMADPRDISEKTWCGRSIDSSWGWSFTREKPVCKLCLMVGEANGTLFQPVDSCEEPAHA